MKPKKMYIIGSLDDDMLAYFLEELNGNSSHSIQNITLFIESNGGPIHILFGILDILNLYSCPVKTIGIGQVCSAAATLLSAGTKGERYVTDMCMLVHHRPQSCGVSTEPDRAKRRLEYDMIAVEKHYEILSQNIGHPVEKIKQDFSDELFLPNGEAIIKYGFADRLYRPERS